MPFDPDALGLSSSQLRSLMGVWSVDLTGLPLKELGGSWELAVVEVLGPPTHGAKFTVPAKPTWRDRRPPPPPSTRCLGELVAGSTTWVTNEAERCDALLVELGSDS